MEWVHQEDTNAPPADPAARIILQAAEDESPKFRYPVNAAFTLALIRLLPDAIWRSLNATGMTRRPKSSLIR
jgi:hypothetical protein